MSNEAAIWWPFCTKDIRSETFNMSKVAKCCYIELLDLLWEANGSIPADDAWLSSELGMTKREWAAVRDRVLRQFIVSNGRLTHPRMAVELDKAKANIEQKRRAGKASAEARKANGRSTDVQQPLPSRCDSVGANDQRNANGRLTAGQPYAGGGGGVSAHQSRDKKLGEEPHTHTREGLTVIAGGAA